MSRTVAAKPKKKDKKAAAEARLVAKLVAPPARPSSIISGEEGFCQELISRRKVADIIRFVYQQRGYERQCQTPLEDYTVGELNRHLELVMVGKYQWITK
jgi:hypothetical protein